MLGIIDKVLNIYDLKRSNDWPTGELKYGGHTRCCHIITSKQIVYTYILRNSENNIGRRTCSRWTDKPACVDPTARNMCRRYKTCLRCTPPVCRYVFQSQNVTPDTSVQSTVPTYYATTIPTNYSFDSNSIQAV